MDLTAEQELFIRREFARRIKVLGTRSPSLSGPSPYLDGWNDCVEEAVAVIMSSDPVHPPDVPERLPRFAKRKDRSYAQVEDIELPLPRESSEPCSWMYDSGESCRLWQGHPGDHRE